ncbi:MAG: hypothetical protein JXR69_06965 [Candidatus Delongbacteria bacterium]|nr:hypothetical protein [Candidatus Delongbacteria bacterium]
MKKEQKDNSTKLNKLSQKKKAFIQVFAGTYGNITKTAEAVGIDRGTYYNWIKSDLEFKQAIEEVEPEEMLIDIVESQLLEKIKSGDITAIIFFLKTKGQKRGYTEKQHIVQEEKKGLTIIVESEEQKRMIEKI